MAENKQELSHNLVNGLTFPQLKNIRNAIFSDNVALLSLELEKVHDINYHYDIYDHNLFIVDWTSDIREMVSSTKLTLLHLSARFGRSNCIQLLLNNHANPNLYSFRGDAPKLKPFLTPLHELCRGLIEEESNFAKSAQLLLESGSDLDARINEDNNKPTAYEICLDIDKPNKEVNIGFRSWKQSLKPLPDIDKTSAVDLIKDIFIEYKTSRPTKRL